MARPHARQNVTRETVAANKVPPRSWAASLAGPQRRLPSRRPHLCRQCCI